MEIEKIKSFAKKHKTALIAGGVGIAAFTIGYIVCKDRMEVKLHEVDGEKILEAMKDSIKESLPEVVVENHKTIDEEIFTRLAPAIEDSLLSDGVNEFWFENTYDVKFPSENGVATLQKHLEVIVSDLRDGELAPRRQLERLWGENWEKVLELVSEQDNDRIAEMFGLDTIEKSNEMVRKVW